MSTIAFASINRDSSNSTSNSRDVIESREANNNRVTNKSLVFAEITIKSFIKRRKTFVKKTKSKCKNR